jgi:hypothetical protein
MTQAVNLANFANSLDSSGGVNPAALNSTVPIAKGGTNASTAAAARTNLGAAASGANGDITSLMGLTTPLSISRGGTSSINASAARTNLGLAIGTDVLAPNGSGSSLTNLNASAISSGTVPVANSGSLRLITRQQVYGTTTANGGVLNIALPTSLFGGNTPSFVMFSASAQVTAITDMRYFFMCSGNIDSVQNIVLGSSSDDTDQGNAARGNAASTFVLPYAANQQFLTFLYGATLFIHVIGYQV